MQFSGPWLCRVLIALAMLAAGTVSHAAPKAYRIGPRPDWVETITPDDAAKVPHQQVSGGVHYVLLDSQTRLEGTQRVRYHHMAIKALNGDGLDDVANIEIEFDPSYQALTIHAVNVRRNGQVIDKLAKATIRVLQREREWEYRILDGALSATVVLEDVRVGDVVEYAYTVRGANPVFGGLHSGMLDQQWARPVHRVVQRLVWPADRPMRFLARNQAQQPAVRELGREREYRWQADDVPALVLQDNMPSWFDPYPTLQWSQFEDWGAVVRWALPLFKLPARLSPAIQAQVDRIAKAHASAQDRVVAVLSLVQSEVRYLGIEMGASSHAPAAPDMVWQRRFGDCKDKALLTVAMLRALGIEASPALVNTKRGRDLPDSQASASAFNHAIVNVRLDGQDHWLDPTLAPQRSALDTLVQSDYSQALVLQEGAIGLTPMLPAPGSRYKRTIYSELDASAGPDQPVKYTVRTVMEGASAQAMRATLASRNREELQKDYLNFYAGYFDGIQALAPVAFVDDEGLNQVTLTERYSVPSIWGKPRKDGSRLADVPVPDLDGLLKSPSDHVREVPLSTPRNVEVLHITQVRLADSPQIQAQQTRVDDPAFHFERDIAAQGPLITFTDRWVSKGDHVRPEAFAAYTANLQKARAAVDYTIKTRAGATTSVAKASVGVSAFNWPVGMLALLLVGGYGAAAAWLYRRDRRPGLSAQVPDAQPLKIAGWLSLASVMVVWVPALLTGNLIALSGVYANETWAALTALPGPAYHPQWAPFLLFKLAWLLAGLVFMGLVAVLFFQRRHTLPGRSVGVAAALVALHAVDLAWTAHMPARDEIKAVLQLDDLWLEIIVVVAWALYCRYSERVRQTFVGGGQAVAAPLPEVEAGLPSQV